MKNIFTELPDASDGEVFQTLLEKGGVTIERIISRGQSTPEGEWYDQDRDEWVLLLSGGAEILSADSQQSHRMSPGDYLHIPAHQRHRVVWTDPDVPTVWLALHFPPPSGNS